MSLSYRTIQLIWSANQLTGFYMRGTSVVKGLVQKVSILNDLLKLKSNGETIFKDLEDCSLQIAITRYNFGNNHCVESVKLWSFFWAIFYRI